MCARRQMHALGRMTRKFVLRSLVAEKSRGSKRELAAPVKGQRVPRNGSVVGAFIRRIRAVTNSACRRRCAKLHFVPLYPPRLLSPGLLLWMHLILMSPRPA